jgi:hypothetical protein
MIDQRVPEPIAKLGTVRDRPFEAAHFDRIEAARGRSPEDRRRRPPPSPHPQPVDPGRVEAPGHDEVTPIGRHVDVRA